jgi:hypothetical protein
MVKAGRIYETSVWFNETTRGYIQQPLIFNIQDDYKLCKLLHKFIGKKVIAAQKLKAHHCEEKLNKFLCRYYLTNTVL